MKPPRSFLLLEVVVGLALLAGLGVWLLKLQTAAVRQVYAARLRTEVATRVERLLWDWSAGRIRVTLPASGRFDERLTWRREVRSVRIAAGVLPTQVSVIVTLDEPHHPPREIYRVDWLVPRVPPDREP
jgi:hypothetical protein